MFYTIFIFFAVSFNLLLLESLLAFNLFKNHVFKNLYFKYIIFLSYINSVTYTICLLYGSGLLEK